jgi:hypothetical protein
MNKEIKALLIDMSEVEARAVSKYALDLWREKREANSGRRAEIKAELAAMTVPRAKRGAKEEAAPKKRKRNRKVE